MYCSYAQKPAAVLIFKSTPLAGKLMCSFRLLSIMYTSSLFHPTTDFSDCPTTVSTTSCFCLSLFHAQTFEVFKLLPAMKAHTLLLLSSILPPVCCELASSFWETEEQYLYSSIRSDGILWVCPPFNYYLFLTRRFPWFCEM